MNTLSLNVPRNYLSQIQQVSGEPTKFFIFYASHTPDAVVESILGEMERRNVDRLDELRLKEPQKVSVLRNVTRHSSGGVCFDPPEYLDMPYLAKEG